LDAPLLNLSPSPKWHTSGKLHIECSEVELKKKFGDDELADVDNDTRQQAKLTCFFKKEAKEEPMAWETREWE
jgi:hypothetical protein